MSAPNSDPTLCAIQELIAAAEAAGWDTTENKKVLDAGRDAYAALSAPAAFVVVVLSTGDGEAGYGIRAQSIRFRTKPAAQVTAEKLSHRDGVWAWMVED